MTIKSHFVYAGWILALSAALSLPAHSASSMKAIYTFRAGDDGGQPESVPIFDSAGNLYGTTLGGGDPSCLCGTVFKLTRQAGGSWNETTLYTFTGGVDGGFPGQLIFDNAGNLYGTAGAGGNTSCSESVIAGCGVVFKLTPPAAARGPRRFCTRSTGKATAEGRKGE